MMKKTIVTLLISSAVLLAACGGNKDNTEKTTEVPKQEMTKITKDIPTGLNIGQRAPDLEYPTPEGELIKLSSLQGKVVLIDFWAGWCPPCRRENPNLVRTWHEFKDKEFKNGTGFTIYSVSLDATKESWVDAIIKDKLDWRYHVSDLKYWESVPAAMYQVRGIPANFLIDGDGVIIAKNLRGEALGARLTELLK